MKLYKATDKDDEDLKSFFETQVIKGIFDYRTDQP